MSHFDDYSFEMPATRLKDRDVERILTRSPDVPDDLAALEQFVAALSSDMDVPRDVDHMATSLAAVARAPRRPRAHGLRRMAVLAAAMAILLAFSGVAMAADGSAPGDPLYGIDRALEAVGIGNGGVDERLTEFDQLHAESEHEAYAFLAEYMESADGPDAAKAQQHLESAVANANSETAQEKVAALREFIEENQGEDGLNGKDFGQGVADIARSGATTPAEGETPGRDPSNVPGPPENPGPPEDPGANSNQVTPDQGEEPGPPSGVAPGQTEDPGPPDESGPPDETGPPGGQAGQSSADTPGDTPGTDASQGNDAGTSSGAGQPGHGGQGKAQGKADAPGQNK